MTGERRVQLTAMTFDLSCKQTMAWLMTRAFPPSMQQGTGSAMLNAMLNADRDRG